MGLVRVVTIISIRGLTGFLLRGFFRGTFEGAILSCVFFIGGFSLQGLLHGLFGWLL